MAKTASCVFKWKDGDKVDLKTLYELANAVRSDKEMETYLYNPDTTDFHLYEFEYDGKNENVCAWTFNNIMWSLYNKDTKKNMATAFGELKVAVDAELDKVKK